MPRVLRPVACGRRSECTPRSPSQRRPRDSRTAVTSPRLARLLPRLGLAGARAEVTDGHGKPQRPARGGARPATANQRPRPTPAPLARAAAEGALLLQACGLGRCGPAGRHMPTARFDAARRALRALLRTMRRCPSIQASSQLARWRIPPGSALAHEQCAQPTRGPEAQARGGRLPASCRARRREQRTGAQGARNARTKGDGKGGSASVHSASAHGWARGLKHELCSIRRVEEQSVGSLVGPVGTPVGVGRLRPGRLKRIKPAARVLQWVRCVALRWWA